MTDLDRNFSLTRGLTWAWLHAASDQDVRAWASDPARGDLWPVAPCDTPRWFALDLTLERWQEWLAGLAGEGRART